MKYEVQQALNEIMEIPPIYRRDYIIEYLRYNMSTDESRQFLHNSYPFVPMVVLNSYTALSSRMTKPCTVAVVSSG